MSRAEARRAIALDQLRSMMAGRTWLQDQGASLVDQATAAYKDVDQVMRDQAETWRGSSTRCARW